MAIEQFGFFAGKDEAIKTLKQTMEDFCKLPDPRNQALKLHFNNLWRLGKQYAELFHKAMLAYFNASSEEHAIVEKAVSHLDDDAKLKATEVALLGKVLVQNYKVIEIGCYSPRVFPRDTLLADTMTGLIKLRFGGDEETQQKLLPLAGLYQEQYNVLRKAEQGETERLAAAPTASRAVLS